MEMESFERTRDDVDVTLQYAKLDANDMQPIAQCLKMAHNLDNDSVKLIEMDDNMLNCLLAGQRLTVRGSKMDSAVLCTAVETFEIKDAETSNSLLLLPECSFTAECLGNISETSAIIREVYALKHEYYELRRIKPRLKRLKDFLEETPYSGDRYDSDQTRHMYTFEELLDTVQASEAELNQGLRELHACFINGCWRVLDFDYMSSIFTSILAAKDEFGWSSNAIPRKQLACVLQDLYPSHVVEHVLECFSHSQQQLSSDNSDENCRLSETAVCRFFAEMMLRTANKYHLREFENAWELAVPDEMKTSLSQLQGLALVDRSCEPEIISYFPVHELPEDIDERFHMLFKAKEKWTLEEITPYIEGICIDGRTGVGSLLTKYARVSTQKGSKLYSSRK